MWRFVVLVFTGCALTPRAAAPLTVIDGDVVIHAEADVAPLLDVGTITGNLIVNSPDELALALPNLQELGGDFQCGTHGLLACRLPSLTLPSLAHAHTIVVCNAGVCGDVPGPLPLASIDLSALTTVTTLWIENAQQLQSLALPSLTSAEVRITATQLGTIELPVLTTGTVSIADSPLAHLAIPRFASGILELAQVPMTELAAPAMTDGQLWVSGSLATLELPALTSAGYVVVSGTQLTSLELPVLTTVTQELGVTGNPNLQRLSTPQLANVAGTFDIENNPQLPTCAVEALWKLLGYPMPVAIAGNAGAGAPCP